MSDLLSASSLLLAIITSMFGLYYESIKRVIDLKPSNYPADDKSGYETGKSVRNSKLIPLVISSSLLTAIFIPETIKICCEACEMMFSDKYKNVKYDTIKTSYVAVTFFMILLVSNIFSLWYDFKEKMKKIDPNRRN